MAAPLRHLDWYAELDLRKLRYFLAVAHHLNFGRAAHELMLAQPALSRAVRALEADLGARLFERDHHHVALTPAGTALVREADALLAHAAATRRIVAAASRPTRTLTAGFRPGIIITDTVRRFTRLHPDVAVDAARIEWDEQQAALADGRIDIAWVRTPIADAGLEVMPLFDDPETLAMPATHPLAAHGVITLADVAHQPMLHYDAAPDHSVGSPAAPSGIRTMEEKLEAVAQGHGLALVPATAAAYYRRPDIIYRPVADAPPYQVALATTPDTARQPDVRAFIDAALAVYIGNP